MSAQHTWTQTQSLHGVKRRKSCPLPLPSLITGFFNPWSHLFNPWSQVLEFSIKNIMIILYIVWIMFDRKHEFCSEVFLRRCFKTFPRDGAQLAKLMKAIFRPWNSYCIQVNIRWPENLHMHKLNENTDTWSFGMHGKAFMWWEFSILHQVDSKSSEPFRALVEKLVACYLSVHPSTDIFLSNVNLSLVMKFN